MEVTPEKFSTIFQIFHFSPSALKFFSAWVEGAPATWTGYMCDVRCAIRERRAGGVFARGPVSLR